MTVRSVLLDLLFPPRCAVCARVGVHGICEQCETSLPYAEEPLHRGAYGCCAAPLRYEGAVRDSLLRFKFRGAQSAAEGYGMLVARCAAEYFSGEFDLVTYVPVSAKRKRERGYDQAYLIAREAARLWGTKPVTLLRKLRDNPAQSGLDAAARRGNVAGVYEAAETALIRGARVLLIDDILTTGSTLSECVRVLKAAGAERVVCACVASAGLETNKEG